MHINPPMHDVLWGLEVRFWFIVPSASVWFPGLRPWDWTVQLQRLLWGGNFCNWLVPPSVRSRDLSFLPILPCLSLDAQSFPRFNLGFVLLASFQGIGFSRSSDPMIYFCLSWFPPSGDFQKSLCSSPAPVSTFCYLIPRIHILKLNLSCWSPGARKIQLDASALLLSFSVSSKLFIVSGLLIFVVTPKFIAFT